MRQHFQSLSRVKSAVRRDDTTLCLGGDGFFWSLTWAADNRQLVAMVDGAGWPARPKDHYYSSRLFAIDGTPQNAACQDFANYPDIPLDDLFQRRAPPYYSSTVLAVGGCIYQYLSTSTMHVYTDELWNQGKDIDLNPDFHFNAAKLIYSPDGGRTWFNQDGTTPVIRELHQDQTDRNMMFLQEPQGAFSLLSFLQMGQDYGENRDGYVYAYAPNGVTEGSINELVMFRVPKARIRDRAAYEYFAGLKTDGNADWARDIDARGVVHTFPRGLATYCCEKNYFNGLESWTNIFAWVPSVVYNAPLNLYMMVNSTAAHVLTSIKGTAPGYLGLWVAERPWGPWRQIHEEVSWTPAGDAAARAGGPVIAPKWIAGDGKSFWLAWCDGGLKSEGNDAPSDEILSKSMERANEEDAFQGRLRWYQYHPGWSFNVQQVELVID